MIELRAKHEHLIDPCVFTNELVPLTALPDAKIKSFGDLVKRDVQWLRRLLHLILKSQDLYLQTGDRVCNDAFDLIFTSLLSIILFNRNYISRLISDKMG